MNLKIAHLGPRGTYAEQAAFFYLNWLKTHQALLLKQVLNYVPILP